MIQSSVCAIKLWESNIQNSQKRLNCELLLKNDIDTLSFSKQKFDGQFYGCEKYHTHDTVQQTRMLVKSTFH